MIIKKTVQVGSSTLVSRVLGVIREILQARFLGVDIASEAFLAAFKIPSMMRKIFAEGALSATLVPTVVRIKAEESRHETSKFMTATFFLFEAALALVCLFIFWRADLVLSVVVPGFSPEKFALAAKFLRVLISLILLMSSSAVLAAVLQAERHFLIPAMAPAVLNVVYIAGLIAGLYYQFDVLYICYFILLGSFINLLLHLIAYARFGYSFEMPDRHALREFGSFMLRCVPYMVSMGVMEINFFIDNAFASYLPGAVTLSHYASRFMGIPLGVFATAFATILLPHFSRVNTYAPRRLGFYLFESAKLVIIVTVPTMLFLSGFSRDVFSTLFASDRFPEEYLTPAAHILTALLIGLPIFSLNRILFNIFYARHDVKVPMMTSLVSTSCNAAGNYFLMQYLGAAGIALSTTLSSLIQMCCMLYFLHKRYRFEFYASEFMVFLRQFFIQLAVIGGLFVASYFAVRAIVYALPLPTIHILKYTVNLHAFMTTGIGFWSWTGLLGGVAFLAIFLTRRRFGYRVHFLD